MLLSMHFKIVHLFEYLQLVIYSYYGVSTLTSDLNTSYYTVNMVIMKDIKFRIINTAFNGRGPWPALKQ